MKISVITASFNQGPYIQRCIDSVRSQTGNFMVEHIIMDNCSSDGTVDILKSYESHPSQVDVKIFVKPDNGQTEAINEGFSMATGDIVCWLNTDEYYAEGALQQVVDFFRGSSSCDVLFGDCDFVDERGGLVRRKREFFFSKSMLIFYGCFMPSCSTFVRRKVLDDGIFLDANYRVTMDFDWYVRIACANFQIRHFPRVLASFTWHETNISVVFTKRRKLERLSVQEKFSGVKGPFLLRRGFYTCMRYYWIVIRVLMRVIKINA